MASIETRVNYVRVELCFDYQWDFTNISLSEFSPKALIVSTFEKRVGFRPPSGQAFCSRTRKACWLDQQHDRKTENQVHPQSFLSENGHRRWSRPEQPNPEPGEYNWRSTCWRWEALSIYWTERLCPIVPKQTSQDRHLALSARLLPALRSSCADKYKSRKARVYSCLWWARSRLPQAAITSTKNHAWQKVALQNKEKCRRCRPCSWLELHVYINTPQLLSSLGRQRLQKPGSGVSLGDFCPSLAKKLVSV